MMQSRPIYGMEMGDNTYVLGTCKEKLFFYKKKKNK